jgi:hypothetical protein
MAAAAGRVALPQSLEERSQTGSRPKGSRYSRTTRRKARPDRGQGVLDLILQQLPTLQDHRDNARPFARKSEALPGDTDRLIRDEDPAAERRDANVYRGRNRD